MQLPKKYTYHVEMRTTVPLSGIQCVGFAPIYSRGWSGGRCVEGEHGSALLVGGGGGSDRYMGFSKLHHLHI